MYCWSVLPTALAQKREIQDFESAPCSNWRSIYTWKKHQIPALSKRQACQRMIPWWCVIPVTCAHSWFTWLVHKQAEAVCHGWSHQLHHMLIPSREKEAANKVYSCKMCHRQYVTLLHNNNERNIRSCSGTLNHDLPYMQPVEAAQSVPACSLERVGDRFPHSFDPKRKWQNA